MRKQQRTQEDIFKKPNDYGSSLVFVSQRETTIYWRHDWIWSSSWWDEERTWYYNVYEMDNQIYLQKWSCNVLITTACLATYFSRTRRSHPLLISTAILSDLCPLSEWWDLSPSTLPGGPETIFHFFSSLVCWCVTLDFDHFDLLGLCY